MCDGHSLSFVPGRKPKKIKEENRVAPRHNHKNDVFRLTELIDPSVLVPMPESVWEDVHIFIERMADEDVDLKQLGIVGRSKEQILQELEDIYRKTKFFI